MANDYIDSSAAYERFTTSEGSEFWAPARHDGKSTGAIALRDDPSGEGSASSSRFGKSLLQDAVAGAQLASDGSVAGTAFERGRHPILRLTQHAPGQGLAHETQMTVLHAMRRYHTTLDTAIGLRRALEGEIYVESDDQGLADALNEWMQEVRVGYLGGQASMLGLGTYLNQLAESADEYGLSAGEILTDEAGTEITRLVVPSTQTLSVRKLTTPTETGATYGLYQQQGSRYERIDQSPLVQTCTFTYPASGEGMWPKPMAWSLVQSTEIVLQMHQSVKSGWWRFGDPSLLVSVQYDPESNPVMRKLGEGQDAPQAPEELFQLKSSLEAVMNARRQGRTGDAYAAVKGGEISQEVLGEIDATLMKFFAEQQGVFDGHVLAAASVPEWMYPHLAQQGDGLGGQRSNNVAIMCGLAAAKRAARKKALAREVIDMHLVLQGDARFVGQYALRLDMVSLVDDKMIAETRRTDAEAVAKIVENTELLYDPETGEERFEGDAADYLRQQEVLQ